MSGFIDLIEALPFGVVAIAILLVLSCAGLIVLAFYSIPFEDEWEPEPTSRTHREFPPERVQTRREIAERVAQHYRNGRWQ